MNIGIDARVLIKQKTGIGYYLENLLINILNQDKENIYFLFSDEKIYFPCLNYENLRIVDFSKNDKLHKSIFWDFCTQSYLVKQYKIDVFWGVQNRLPLGLKGKCKTLLTVHDLICFQEPKTIRLRSRVYNQIFIPISIKSADKIVAVSNYTKKDIVDRFGKDTIEDKIHVIYEDIKATKIVSTEECYEKLFGESSIIKPRKYILYVGTIESRKNIETLIDAYTTIKKNIELKLVICGKMGWKGEEVINKIDNHPYKDSIIYLNYVTDEEKYLLMKNCFTFVFPSLYEGFGLPVIEAIKMNAVAIVSSNSSLDELIENSDLKFKTGDSNELSQKIIELFKDDDLYNSANEYCKRRAKDFKWDSFAKQYIDIISNIQ